MTTTAPRMIERRMVFGVREDVKNGAQYLDENNIVWVAGRSLVIFDTQLGTQQIIPCSPACESVSAMALSVNRRLLAVAESGKVAVVVVYLVDTQSGQKLKRKKVLQVPDLGSTEYVAMDFSQDGKQLVALGGFPEWRLVYWNVEKGKMVASCGAVENPHTVSDLRHLNHCTLCPSNSALVCVSGSGMVRFFDVTEGHMFPSSGGVVEEGTQYLSHTWVIGEEGRLIVSTSNGDLLWFENKTLRFPLPLSPSDGLAIQTLASYSKGFVCGGDMGLITIFERNDSKEMYRKVRTLRFNQDDEGPNALPQRSGEVPVILAFTLTPPPAEEYLAFLTSTKQLYHLNLPNADFTKAEDLVFQPVGQPFHSGAITGVDACVQRPLVVTAGRDRCVFLWNTITHTVELRKRFASEILSVALHPSGQHLLVGFADGLQFMNVYDKDICEYKNLGIRGCTACCFSSGGQYFAAAHSTSIHVYYTYTCELLGHLRGHNGKVKSLFFVPPADTRLISTGTDGAVFEFSLSEFHKVSDCVMKAVTYHCAAADVATVWAAGNDRKLRQIERAKLKHFVEYDLASASLLSMAISPKMKLLFGGAEDGTVRVFNTYLGEKLTNIERDSGGVSQNNITIENHITHSGAVTRLVLTYDEGLLVSVGEDGVVVFWNVVAPHRTALKEIEYVNELLVDRREMEATSKLLETLKDQVVELKHRAIQQQSKRERLYEDQLSRLDRDHSEEIHQQRRQIAALQGEKNEQAIRFTEFTAELDTTHAQTLQQTNEDYNAKIESLQERADQLRHLISESNRVYEKQVAEMKAEALTKRNEERQRQQTTLHTLEEEQHALVLQKERHDAETEAMGRMMEEDNDQDIIQQRELYEKRRREQLEELATLQAANNNLLSKENLNRADLEAKLADVGEKLRQQATLESRIESAKRDIEALSNELRERGETIAEKERRVSDLHKKNEELEKFKFVLEYKIKELKAQIDPRDEEIRAAKEKLAQMDKEAEQYQHSNENLVLQIRSLRQKRAGQQRELDSLTAKAKAAEEFQACLWTELTDLHEELDRPRRLKELAKALYDRYTVSSTPAGYSGSGGGGGGALASSSSAAAGGAASRKALTSRTAVDEVREYHRERDHLERNLANLKRKVMKDAENGRTDKSRIITENVILVREINELRKEARTLASKAGLTRPTDPTGASAYEEEYSREMASQRAEMERLRQLAEQLEGEFRLRGLPLPLPGLM